MQNKLATILSRDHVLSQFTLPPINTGRVPPQVLLFACNFLVLEPISSKFGDLSQNLI